MKSGVYGRMYPFDSEWYSNLGEWFFGFFFFVSKFDSLGCFFVCFWLDFFVVEYRESKKWSCLKSNL